MGYGPLTLRFLASSSSTSPSAEYGLPFTLSTSATTDALRPSPGPRSALGYGLHPLRPFWFLPLRPLRAHLLRLCPLWVLPVRLRPSGVRRFRRLHRFGLSRPYRRLLEFREPNGQMLHERRQRRHHRGEACRCGPPPAASVPNPCAGVSGARGTTSPGGRSPLAGVPSSLGTSGDLGASRRRRSSSRSLWASSRSLSATSRRRRSSESSASRVDWARSDSSRRTRAASARLASSTSLSASSRMALPGLSAAISAAMSEARLPRGGGAAACRESLNAWRLSTETLHVRSTPSPSGLALRLPRSICQRTVLADIPRALAACWVETHPEAEVGSLSAAASSPRDTSVSCRGSSVTAGGSPGSPGSSGRSLASLWPAGASVGTAVTGGGGTLTSPCIGILQLASPAPAVGMPSISPASSISKTRSGVSRSTRAASSTE